MIAAVLGGSGSVGKEVVKHLLALPTCERIILINRRDLDLKSSFDLANVDEKTSKISQHVVDMEELNSKSTVDILAGAQVNTIFLTLGVGAPSKLPSGEKGKNELLRVDCTLPSQFAEAAKEAGVKHVSLLTAVSPDINATYGGSTSAVSGWYRHVKAKVEENITEKKFESFAVFRPSTLVGASATPGFVGWLAPKLDWLVPVKYSSIHIKSLADKMVRNATQNLDTPCEKFVAEGKSLVDI